MASISVVSLTRFHFFALASGLNEAFDTRVISGHPQPLIALHYPEVAPIHRSVPVAGLLKGVNLRVFKSIALDAFATRQFSAKAAKKVAGSDVVIAATTNGAPSFAATPNALHISDHGSLHPRYEQRVLEDEGRRFGFAVAGNEKHAWRFPLIDRDLEMCDRLNLGSQLAAETFAQEGFPPERIIVNTYGVETALFSPPPPDRPQERISDKIRVIFVGASIPRKGVHRLLRALVDAGLDRFSLTCVGAVPSDPVMIAEFDKARAAGLEVTSVPPVPEAALIDFYHNADVFCLPSLADGWGLVTNQAMASGLPCLVSQYAGSADCVTPTTGRVFDPLNHEAFVAMLRELSLDQLASGGGASAHRAEEQNWAAYRARARASMRELLGDSRGAGGGL